MRYGSLQPTDATTQFEFLADSIWSHYAYGKNAIYQHGHHGNAILSELPFAISNNVDVYDAYVRDGLSPWAEKMSLVHSLIDKNLNIRHGQSG